MSLTRGEQEDLKMLLNISSSIHNNFIKLLDLERNGQKETEEYKSLISSINSSKLLENSIIDRLLSSEELSFSDIQKELLNEKEIRALDAELDVAINGNTDELIKRRVYVRLKDKVRTKKVERNYFDSKLIKFRSLLEEDFINTTLTILNEVIHNENGHQNTLLSFKYNLAFLYEFVENDLLEHDFNINPTLYWNAQFYAELKKLSPHNIKFHSFRVVRTIIDTAIEEILNSENDYSKVMILQIILRASLLFAGEDLVKCHKENFEKEIFAKTMLKSHSDREEIILTTINKFYEDRDLPSIINLGVSL